jgi:GNAT superfamily N-acetyltransferase
MYSQETITGWLKGRSPEGYRGIAKKEMYVFEDQAEILGFSHVVPGEVVAIFVSPKSARKGIGTVLLNHAIPYAEGNWDGPIRIEATLNAVHFYKSAGFKKVEETIVVRNEIEIPIVIMEKGQI